MRPVGVVLVASITIVLGACATGGGSRAPNAESGDLTIFAAASLKGALDQAKATYESANAGVTITISTDSSAALATQIDQGAPADVFLSADTTTPQQLVDRGLARGKAVVFAANELAIIVPIGNPADIATPADLARPGVKVIAAGDEVPITSYANELVHNLAMEAGYPADYADAYAANVVSKEDNVKAVVAKVELGEGDAGIAYVTDAAASEMLETVDVPAAANVRARYAGVVLLGSPRTEAARAFLDWFAGPEGQAVLTTFGFVAPSE